MPDFRVVAERGRYVLGEEEDSYGIWDLESGSDEPVERFPMTDKGFEDSWDRMRTLARGQRTLLVRGLRAAVVLGLAAWVLGLAWFLLPTVGIQMDFDHDFSGVATFAEAVGFRVAIACMIGLGAMAAWNRWYGGRSLTREDRISTLSDVGRLLDPLGAVLIITLGLWILSAFVTAFYEPSFERPPVRWMQIGLLVQYVSFRLSILIGVLIGLRWIRTPTGPPGSQESAWSADSNASSGAIRSDSTSTSDS